MESFSIQYIFELQKLSDGYFSAANEAIIRKSEKPAVATQAPVATASLFSPSSSPDEATSAEQDLSTKVRVYEDLYLAIGAPEVSVLPSDSQAEQVIELLGAAFVDHANSEVENKAVVGVDFSLQSVQLDQGIPAEQYNGTSETLRCLRKSNTLFPAPIVLLKFSPSVECVIGTGGCLADDGFRATLFDSFSEELLYAVRDLEGGFFSSLKEAYLLSSKSKAFAEHDDGDASEQDDRKLTQQVWLHL